MSYYEKILRSLKQLKELYPNYNMGRHISTVIDEQGDVWGMSDKEFSCSLEQYIKALALDKPHTEKEIDQIIEDGMHLDRYKLLEDAPLIDE